MPVNLSRLLAVAVLPLLAVTAACGQSAGDDGEQGNTTAPDVSATATENTRSDAAEAALTQQQLKEVLLATDAIAGFIGADSHQEPLRPKADRSECQPLADLTAVGTDRSPQAKAFAARGFAASGQPASAGEILTIALLSYEKGGTKETIDRIRSALAICGSGFKTSGNAQGQTLDYSQVKESKSFTDGAQSVRFRMVAEGKGAQLPMDIQVVASGSTIAQFLATNIKDSDSAVVPENAVADQVEELERVASS